MQQEQLPGMRHGKQPTPTVTCKMTTQKQQDQSIRDKIWMAVSEMVDQMREMMSAQVGRARATLRGYMDQIPGQRINIHWHDEINADAEGQFRFYFQNPNGLAMDPTMMTQDLQTMKQFDVSCFGFAETNLAWNKPHIAMQYKQL